MPLPLSDVRILDLSVILSGPYGTMLLGDLGAEIIKIERPVVGEPCRGMPLHFYEGESAYFISVNRNKKSMTLDLQTEKGRTIFYELTKRADVVFDNFRPGVLQRLKVDYDTLREINPRIISCSISGYGHTGPFKDRPAFDLVIQARGGIMSYNGERGRTPVKLGAPMGDMAGGIFAANGVVSALYQREKTGKGQKIDISLLDCQISLLTYRAQNYFVADEVAEPTGSEHVSIVPIGNFKTKTFDIVIDCNTQKIFTALCEGMDLPDLPHDPNFNSRENRTKNREELNRILRRQFLTRTGEEWLERLDTKVPIAPINTVDRALSDPQVLSRNMVKEIDFGKGKKLKVIGNPIKMSEIEREDFKAPPRLGQDTEDILKSILHYSPEEIEILRQQKII